jgi:hypothetical protein
MTALRTNPISGLTPPQTAEARIREAWPSVASFPAVAGLGRLLTNTIVLAPLGWLVMSAVYFGKLMPLLMRRYTLSNRRVMIRHGWAGTVAEQVALKDIDDVRLVNDANSQFFRAGNLQVMTKGQVALTLTGIPEPESFRQLILSARNAWVPGRVRALPFIPASATN